MSDAVLLDYTSMNGGNPVQQSPNQIIDVWASLLPGFNKTHHQVGDFKVNEMGNRASVTYYGKADYYLDNDVYTVEANYETMLAFNNDRWVRFCPEIVY